MIDFVSYSLCIIGMMLCIDDVKISMLEKRLDVIESKLNNPTTYYLI